MTEQESVLGIAEPSSQSSRPGMIGLLLRLPLLAFTLASLCGQATSSAAETRVAGIVEPFVDVTLSASVPGIVTGRNFAEGAFITNGAVLIELDSNLERLEVKRRKVVSDQKFEDFEATKQLFTSTKGVSKEEVDTKEAEYRVAAVEHEMAVEQLRRRQVVAPHSGVITDISIEPGESCQPYEPLLRLVDTAKCYLVLNIESTQTRLLKQDQKVLVDIDLGGESAVLPGKIVFISPLVDPASGLQKLKVLFENKEGRVRPGLTGFLLTENPA